MAPRPTGRYGLLRIPAPGAARVEIRFALLANRDKFNPAGWPLHGLTASAGLPGWWEFDLDAQGLADGSYEYEFVLDGDTNSPAADPYADELTRFGGYRGVFRMLGGVRVKQGFRWDDEVVAGLPGNNQIVIYEMPLKWMTSATDNPLVDLGTFDQTIYEHLDDLRSLGVNCIELLPIADTPQTLDWGYGTRFFFAPDLDMGVSVDAKFFVKACHARGIRVLLDVVMDFYSNRCPLNQLARPWFEEPTPGTRNGWGAILFRFDTPEPPGYFAAREFLCEMAEFWVMEYHIDGYRIDDFADVGNWAFVQEFRNRATAASAAAFPGKPFLVVAEDSNRRFVLTDGSAYQGAKVVDGIWNFGFQDEIRKLVTNSLSTDAGKPGRTERVKHFLGVGGTWNGYSGSFDPGYGDMTCAVNYATSHDVANAPRMMNLILEPMLGGLGLTKVDAVRSAVDMSLFGQPAGAVTAALDRVFGVFALIMTSVGIPDVSGRGGVWRCARCGLRRRPSKAAGSRTVDPGRLCGKRGVADEGGRADPVANHAGGVATKRDCLLSLSSGLRHQRWRKGVWVLPDGWAGAGERGAGHRACQHGRAEFCELWLCGLGVGRASVAGGRRVRGVGDAGSRDWGLCGGFASVRRAGLRQLTRSLKVHDFAQMKETVYSFSGMMFPTLVHSGTWEGGWMAD